MTRKKATRGFASMDPERRKEVATEAGKAAHAEGKAHELTTEEARAAGSKGGKAPRTKALAKRKAQEEVDRAAKRREHIRRLLLDRESKKFQ